MGDRPHMMVGNRAPVVTSLASAPAGSVTAPEAVPEPMIAERNAILARLAARYEAAATLAVESSPGPTIPTLHRVLPVSDPLQMMDSVNAMLAEDFSDNEAAADPVDEAHTASLTGLQDVPADVSHSAWPSRHFMERLSAQLRSGLINAWARPFAAAFPGSLTHATHATSPAAQQPGSQPLETASFGSAGVLGSQPVSTFLPPWPLAISHRQICQAHSWYQINWKQ